MTKMERRKRERRKREKTVLNKKVFEIPNPAATEVNGIEEVTSGTGVS
jgi:hypothetical protein